MPWGPCGPCGPGVPWGPWGPCGPTGMLLTYLKCTDCSGVRVDAINNGVEVAIHVSRFCGSTGGEGVGYGDLPERRRALAAENTTPNTKHCNLIMIRACSIPRVGVPASRVPDQRLCVRLSGCLTGWWRPTSAATRDG